MKPEPGAQAPDLFYALQPDDAVRGALAGWAKSVKGAVGGRATRASKLHMTLAYIGATEPGRQPEAKRICHSVAVEPFTLILDRVGYWKNNRIAWAGSSVTPPGLERLVADLRAALAAAGLPVERKAFFPHVTLVRDAGAQPELEPEPAEWRVRGFVLLETVWGADYRLWEESPAG